jgi:hypothetical protein
MRVLYFFLIILLYSILLIITNVIHAHFFSVDVVFYSALFDASISAVLLFFILGALGYLKHFNGLELLQMTLILLLSGYIYAISIPTVIDRSLSFYILEKIAQRGGGINKSAMETIFTKEYVKEHRLVDVRLTEQLESGTIYIENNCIKLTDWGKALARFSRFYRTNLLPKNRLLMGERTDDLTDPFRKSFPKANYSCK